MAARRPIAARQTRLARDLTAWLVARRASPDGISLLGMASGLAAGFALAATAWLPAQARALWLLGAGLVTLRLAANMLDGMVAIARGMTSPRGELFNEVPDRVSDTSVLVGVGLAAGSLPWGLAAALAAMATAYVRAVGVAAGAPADFRGPMAKPQRMAAVVALAVWYAATPAAWHALPGGTPVAALVLAGIAALSLLTAARRLRAAARALPGHGPR